MPHLPSLFASAAGLSLEMPVSGTDRLCRPLCKHFCYWKLSDGASARLILLSLTQTRLFGPPRGCRSHCLVRDSGAQPECLERRSGSCATSPLELRVVALAVQGRQQLVEERVSRS